MAQETFNRMVFDAALGQSQETLADGTSPVNLLQIVDDAIEFSENLMGEFAGREIAGLEDIDCQSGCAWCCYQQVGVTGVQAIHIADYLREGKAGIDASAAIERLTTADRLLHGLGKIERLAASEPCAFLGDDNACQIYPVRPFACRGANSIDVEFCRRIVEDLEAVREELDREGGSAWIHALPFQSMAALQDGLLSATIDAGLSEEKLELTSAVLIALSDPEAAKKWATGEAVFVAARLPDTTRS